MTIQISEYADVKKRALDLGLNVPTGIAILPRNFAEAKSKDELMNETSAPTVRVLWRQAGVSETRIEKDEKFPYLEELGFAEWVGPIIFVNASLLSQNPHLVTVALNVVSNYLTDFFKGIVGERNVRLEVAVEKRNGGVCKIHYEGTPEGLHELPAIIQEASARE